MGAMTLVTELLSLISAAVVLVVGVVLLGLWASTRLFSQQALRIAFVICGVCVGGNGVFGLATWIVLIVNRGDVPNGVILGRETVIATGFACWGFVLCTQVCSRLLYFVDGDCVYCCVGDACFEGGEF